MLGSVKRSCAFVNSTVKYVSILAMVSSCLYDQLQAPVGAADTAYSVACNNTSSSSVVAGAAMDQMTTRLIVNPLIGQPTPPPHRNPVPVSAVSTGVDTDL